MYTRIEALIKELLQALASELDLLVRQHTLEALRSILDGRAVPDGRGLRTGSPVPVPDGDDLAKRTAKPPRAAAKRKRRLKRRTRKATKRPATVARKARKRSKPSKPSKLSRSSKPKRNKTVLVPTRRRRKVRTAARRPAPKPEPTQLQLPVPAEQSAPAVVAE